MSDQTPDAVREHVREELVRFVRALRHEGASVPANAATTGARALVEVGLEDRTRVRTALRASLLADRDDFEAFDRLFGEFWRRLTAALDAGRSASPTADDPGDGPARLGAPSAGEEPGNRPADRDEESGTGSPGESFGATVTDDPADADDETGTALYSPSGSPRSIAGRPLPGADELESALEALTRALAGLRGRRFRRGTTHADVRRALRESVGTGGTVLSVPERDRARPAVRALLLVDVSRSVLDAVDRGFLMEFLRQARREWRDVRVFFFDEDLREVTGAVGASSATGAMEALEAAEAAWGGGTRIGGSLARLHETAPDAVDRRTVAFVVSDGLEMGDVSILERELSWLARRAERVLWLNPLAAAESYEPTARGMAAALPYIDGLFAFATPDDVAELARQLRRQGPGGRIGYEFDARRTDRWTTQPTHDP